MSLDLIDARFLLPRPPATAVVLGDLPHWRNGLVQAGVELVEPGEDADLAVMAGAAAAAGGRMTLVEGGRAPGARQFFAAPQATAPRLLLPLRQPDVAGYALRRFEAPTRPATTVRNALASGAVGLGVVPRRFVVSVGGDSGAPYLLRAARDAGAVSADARWFLATGQGDVLSRSAFMLFTAKAGRPTHVLKFARVTNYTDPFERDERGLGLIRDAGDALAAHAPKLIARFNAAGTECSLESAAVGERLFAALQRQSDRAAREQLITAVTEWLIEVEAATKTASVDRGPIERLAGEWDIESQDVRLPDDLAAVLEHNDAGSWNVVVDGRDFTVLDWEDANERGLPLADVWYFLADTLAHLDGVPPERRPEHFVQLFRGELPSSRVLFTWTARAVERLRIPASAVGPLATICWLRHGSADRRRRQAATELASTKLAPIDFGQIAQRWLSEPGLGPTWDRWAQART